MGRRRRAEPETDPRDLFVDRLLADPAGVRRERESRAREFWQRHAAVLAGEAADLEASLPHLNDIDRTGAEFQLAKLRRTLGEMCGRAGVAPDALLTPARVAAAQRLADSTAAIRGSRAGQLSGEVEAGGEPDQTAAAALEADAAGLNGKRGGCRAGGENGEGHLLGNDSGQHGHVDDGEGQRSTGSGEETAGEVPFRERTVGRVDVFAAVTDSPAANGRAVAGIVAGGRPSAKTRVLPGTFAGGCEHCRKHAVSGLKTSTQPVFGRVS